ncbi:MAG: hypothetical protein NC048_10025 [Bacteroides sp.]|nr:hypothetical protein [Bacteroides sp.]MCM1555811.1 hypothetical protein [Bacteroides sp.]
MSTEYTKIYEYKIAVYDLMDFVLAEQARKNYSGGADQEANAAMFHEFSMTEDDAHWFKTYLQQALSLICTRLQPLQKYLEEPYQLDDLVATLRFRLSPLYKTQRLEDVIREALGNYVCYRWYLMKNLPNAGAPYQAMFDGNLSELKGFGVRGIYGRCTAVRPYDMGFGAVMPEPYMDRDIVIRDIRWQNTQTAFRDLFTDNKHHLPDKNLNISRPLPGVTVVGNNEIILEDGDNLPMDRYGDRGMILPANPDREVVIRRNNETDF